MLSALPIAWACARAASASPRACSNATVMRFSCVNVDLDGPGQPMADTEAGSTPAPCARRTLIIRAPGGGGDVRDQPKLRGLLLRAQQVSAVGDRGEPALRAEREVVKVDELGRL